MPTLVRNRAVSRRVSDNEIPSTMMSPDWMVSSRLMQRMSVLLPLPLGPQTTTAFPASITRSMSFRTCSVPNHLLTLRNSITASEGHSVDCNSLAAYYMNKGFLQPHFNARVLKHSEESQ